MEVWEMTQWVECALEVSSLVEVSSVAFLSLFCMYGHLAACKSIITCA